MRSSYEHHDYDQLIDKISRRPAKPVVGHTTFVVLIVSSWLAQRLLKIEFAGMGLLILLLWYPYYWVQLLMQRRMRNHQALARRAGVNPSYVPSSPRAWAGIYVVAFFASTGVLIVVDKLLGFS